MGRRTQAPRPQRDAGAIAGRFRWAMTADLLLIAHFLASFDGAYLDFLECFACEFRRFHPRIYTRTF